MVSDGCPTINIGEVAPLLSIVLSVCLATPTITNQSEILTPFQTQYKASLKILSSRVLKLCLKVFLGWPYIEFGMGLIFLIGLLL